MDKYLIGVDLGGTNIKIGIYQYESFSIIKESRISTQANLGSQHVLERIFNGIISILHDTQIESSGIVGIGIGVPGLLDIETGISKFSPNFSAWENVHITEWLERRLNIPTYIDNDVRVNLYGEWQCGCGKGKKNIVLLTLGTGLGSGIVMDGHVLYGVTASAGEIGHMNMYRDGRPCKCGSSGCLGRYVSALGMLCTLKEKLEDNRASIIRDWVLNDLDKITAKMVSDAFDSGDAVAIETMEETGRLLGYGLVNIINLYNPEVIIIGGGMSAAGERLIKPARAVVKSHALKISCENCSIVTALLGDTAGMLGAAIYAKQRLEHGTRL